MTAISKQALFSTFYTQQRKDEVIVDLMSYREFSEYDLNYMKLLFFYLSYGRFWEESIARVSG